MTERRSRRRIDETPPWKTSSSPTCCRWGPEAMNGVDEAGVVTVPTRAHASQSATSSPVVLPQLKP